MLVSTTVIRIRVPIILRDFSEIKKQERLAKDAEYGRRYREKLKEDPVRLAAYRLRKKRTRKEYMQRMKAERPETYKLIQKTLRKRYAKRNPEKVKERKRARNRRAVEAMSDSYIKKLVVGTSKFLSMRDIPTSLIDTKRALLELKRELNEKHAGIKEDSFRHHVRPPGGQTLRYSG